MQLETTVLSLFDSAGTFSAESPEICASALRAILGDVALEGDKQALKSTRGIYCNIDQLRVMTCYFPLFPTLLRGEGTSHADRLLMVRSMEGPLVVRQSGQTVNLEPGEFLFLSANSPFEWRLSDGGRIDCGSLPVRYFPANRQALGRFLLRPIPKEHPPLKLLITHAAYLLMRGAHAPGEAEMVVAHFKQVLPMVVEYLHDGKATDRASADLSRIKAFIESRLSDQRFDLASVADKFGVTPRHVQKLFQGEGTTFSRYVLNRRLETARSLMLRQVHQPISTIAYDSGFGDVSYFNRVFRQNFGMTPTAMRHKLNATSSVSNA